MQSRGKPVFDLNRAPMDSSAEFDAQKAPRASRRCNPDSLEASTNPPCVENHTDLSHKSSASKFHPIVRTRNAPRLENNDSMKNLGGDDSDVPSIPESGSKGRKVSADDSGSVFPQAVEREEGEWSDGELITDVSGKQLTTRGKALQEQGLAGPRLNTHVNELGCSDGCIAEDCSEADFSDDGPRGSDAVSKKKEVKGTEASYALKSANSIGKKHKLDEQKEAMLGKKRNRQTMFLKLEDVKQVGVVKSLTPKRQSIPPPSSRIMRGSRSFPPPAEHNGEMQNEFRTKVQNQGDLSFQEERISMEPSDSNSEGCTDINAVLLTRSRSLSTSIDLSIEINNEGVRQNSLKLPSENIQAKNAHPPLRKPPSMSTGSVGLNLGGNKRNPPKKQTVSSSQYQDTSVERLLREVTSDKLWHSPEDAELQCVPDQFESVEEYVRVFEPLLFEECRAQLFSTWEELTEASFRDAPIVARIKGIERRERGWFDVIIMPVNEIKWMFKEGDVAVLSSAKPSSVRSRRCTSSSTEEDKETEAIGRVIGTIRRYRPIDTRDPLGAVLHFYVGDSYDVNRCSADNDQIMRKLQPREEWYLTVLGSLATTQREYIGLHAFWRLRAQMQDAILQPSPEHFPKYEEQSPIIPECFTPNFVEHLHRAFNSPQLAAIQWAATHTAAGTNEMARKQDPWPFTLVQGPPGTGKTHTVWGMLNVIHLVQYQHYYNALLKKLAPDSYKVESENNDNVVSGSIDEVLKNMDQNLFRTLPKLCPKPRMLVCAPSNAATDELLARILDRGFIDGEMRKYWPDVARVGVDSQSAAAQAVSVERRTDNLLKKSREEVYGWLQHTKVRENHSSFQIANLQRQLFLSAAAGRSVGVDPDALMAREKNRDALLQNLAAAVEERDKVLVEMSRLLIVEGFFRGTGFNLEEARASLEASFANEAEIVFTTLSSSGRKLFSRLTHGFDMVVIDEAAQASEMALLPPLNLGAARCVLVGDPQQLPPTVISKAAGILQYSRSLFERFQQAGCPTMLLSVQYRMHPQIRDFPSRHFYQGRLTDSESVVNLPDEKYYQDTLLRPYIFYDVSYGRESHKGGSVSYQNVHEAQFCRHLYEHLQKSVKSLGLGKVSVGIITPYKLQLRCLQREFEEVLSSAEGRDLYINTVDAFQGQERDVIIMSCVRASVHGVGFVSDIRRMNVALTRARRALWVMGNANALSLSEDWAALIADAKARNCYMDMDSLPTEFQISKAPSYRPRWLDMPAEFKPGSTSERGLVERNDNHRFVRPNFENLANGLGHIGDGSRESRPFGAQKRHNFSGPAGRREF